MFWKKKAKEAVASEGRLDSSATSTHFARMDSLFACRFCAADSRKELILAVRNVETFYAMWPDQDGKVASLPLDDETDLRTCEGRFICTSCALSRDIPGLDKEKLRSLLAGLQSAKSSATH